MKRKQLWRVLGTGGLALSLFASPMTGVSALAADDTQADAAKTGSSLKGLNPLQEAYTDTEIPVWGFTQDSIVYSVDVEWGAMTFQYENNTWDPENHVSIPGAGWQVYDSATDKVVVGDDGAAVTEDAINEIKVTNHSNAGVWATLTYAGETGYTDITGAFSFTKGTETGDSDVLTAAAADKSVPAYLTLATADSNPGGTGAETVGKAYFMPTNPDPDKGETAPSNITKWTEIGKITVGIKTEDPAPPAGP